MESASGDSAERAPSGRTRVVWLDWLRVIAITGIFWAHIGQVFVPWIDWFVNNDVRSRAIGVVVVFVAPWVLPLFMLLSGWAVALALTRRSNAQFVRERVSRILLPLLVGLLIIVPPQLYVERVWHGDFDGTFAEFFPTFFTTGLYPDGNFALRHLWFLAHLFVYSLVALPLFRYWRTADGRESLSRTEQWIDRRRSLVVLGVLLAPLVLQHHVLWFLLPRDDASTNDWSNMSTLFVAFCYGFLIAELPSLRRAVDESWRTALAIACALSGLTGLAAWYGLLPQTLPPPSTAAALLFWFGYVTTGWAWVVGLIGLGRRYLVRESPFLRYGRRTAFGWYYLHQTVIIIVAPWVVSWQAPVPVKVAGLALITIGVTAVGAEVVSRMLERTPA